MPELVNGKEKIILSEKTGSVVSYIIDKNEMCLQNGENRPIFTFKMLSEKGEVVYLNSLDAEKIEVKEQKNRLELNYINIKKNNVIATVECGKDEGFLWSISIENHTKNVLEWVEYPQMVFVDDMKGKGGNSEILWPAMEGIIIDDISVRENNDSIKYREMTGQLYGFAGYYPGCSPMQFTAYYGKGKGIYFGAHDKNHCPKMIDFHELDGGIMLDIQTYCNGALERFDLGYSVLTKGFAGDWQDACEIYRDWMENNIAGLVKLSENKRIPDWFVESPVIMIYPIKGTMDTGDMTPNMYYPYKNILPISDDYKKKTDSKLMLLLMHWEGTAPWAPPYVWPPFGGEKEFTDFVADVHKQNNLVGVYCSGIGWTTKSWLNPEFDKSSEYDEKLMCRIPTGEIVQSKVVGEPIRNGYDMCPHSEKVDNIVSCEIEKIAESECDYAQYFDQNLGGSSGFCYAKDHNHPMTPGKWQNDDMIRIYNSVYDKLDKMGSSLILGCECASAEPFIKYLPLNDLRYEWGYLFGKPVPAYSYVFHEYINNFMGNQNCIQHSVLLSKNPDSLLFRIAYSFVAGDLLTIVLGKDGNIIFGWDVSWDEVIPNQEDVLTLIKNLNKSRREFSEFIHKGKMVKPISIENQNDFEIYMTNGKKLNYSEILTSRWKNQFGDEKQVVVNFQREEKKFTVKGKEYFIDGLSCCWID